MFCIPLSVNATMNTGVQVCFQIRFFSRYMPGSGIAVSYFLVFFLRNFHTIFHSGCTNLHSQQQCEKVQNQENNPIYVASKRIKYLGINLSKEARDLYSENYKMLMKEIEDDTDGKICQLISLEGSILLK